MACFAISRRTFWLRILAKVLPRFKDRLDTRARARFELGKGIAFSRAAKAVSRRLWGVKSGTLRDIQIRRSADTVLRDLDAALGQDGAK